jgi:hypothetical protein
MTDVSSAPPSWREQYDRVLRWERRLRRYRLDPDNPEYARDNFFAFAQACYHLVDWLENDKSQPIRRHAANEFVAATPVLVFCREICKGSKHAVHAAKMKKVNVTTWSMPVGDGKAEAAWLSVENQGHSFSADAFAHLCIASWRKFLRDKKLLK